jgi:hypothetical protein
VVCKRPRNTYFKRHPLLSDVVTSCFRKSTFLTVRGSKGRTKARLERGRRRQWRRPGRRNPSVRTLFLHMLLPFPGNTLVLPRTACKNSAQWPPARNPLKGPIGPCTCEMSLPPYEPARGAAPHAHVHTVFQLTRGTCRDWW